jgi:tRNA A-37 threonylcarbamoyl transferase component Bud32
MLERIGRFEVLDKIGEGAMGTVYRANDPTIGRVVAIKTVRLDARLSQEARDRIVREARSAGILSHPNIVTIYDVSTDSEHAYIAMEYVDGRGLDRLIEESGPFRPVAILPWLDQVADALDYAHKKGVIHRDVKPANVLITNTGQVKLADFGIAKMTSTASTDGNLIVGTPGYMSPEQIRGSKLDHRSDVFSLGVLTFELLSGRRPFESETVVSTIYKVVHEPPQSLHELVPAVSERVDEVVQRALAKDPADRYESCRAMVDALRRVAQRETSPEAVAEARNAAMWKCAKCGAELRPNVKFCFRCGTVAVPPREAFRTVGEGIPAVGSAEPVTVDLDATTDLPPIVDDLLDTNPTRVEASRPTGAYGQATEFAEAAHPVSPHDFGIDHASLGQRPTERQAALPSQGLPPLAAYARSTGSLELPRPGDPIELPPPASTLSDLKGPIILFLVLVVAALAAGYWIGPRLFGIRAQTTPAEPAAPANTPPLAAPAPPSTDAVEAAASFASAVIEADSTSIEDGALALGKTDGKFARIKPGGSLSLALPAERVIRDDGTLAPEVRVTGDPRSGPGPYQIFARKPGAGYVSIDKVQRFSSHDMNHHKVAEADAFRIVNTGPGDLLIDSVEFLRPLEAR